MSAGKLIIGFGAVGAAAGIGYMIWRHLERCREAAEREGAEERQRAETRDAEERQQAEEAEARRDGKRRKFLASWRAEEQRKAEEHRKAEERRRIEQSLEHGAKPSPEPNESREHSARQLGAVRVNQSHLDDEGTVTESPEELLD